MYDLHIGTAQVVSYDKNIAEDKYNARYPTKILDQIMLIDKNGKERSLQLENFNVACREGHILSAIWASKKGEDRGWYIAVRNHTTSSNYFGEEVLRIICKRGSIHLPTFMICWVLFFFFGIGAGVFFGVLFALTAGSLFGFVFSLGARDAKAAKEANRLKPKLVYMMEESFSEYEADFK